ncbi:hypothetical protein jhhlp_000910 [Lomentospora prolificans]|uniref:N-acetyltransferase domain-containing protein n=1 Tax=Lomentospora prolificans TaxID=41688 RepID=A0A2N3NK20_9PEZI|nr:hypothetical protein jhhlp_000910 [Lomentospora prolificans]
MEPTKIVRIRVKTTLPRVPYPPAEERHPVITERLIIRPLAQSDLDALHALRRIEAVMVRTSQGAVDPDIETTKQKLDLYLPPNDKDTYNFAICERATGNLVGIGGSHIRQDHFGWPVVGYVFHPSIWGKGYATEFVKAFMEMWWSLPRAEADVDAEAGSVKAAVIGDEYGSRPELEVEEGAHVREMMIGVTQEDNLASAKILTKCDFKRLEDWIVKSGDGVERLYVFSCQRPIA